MTHDPSTQAPFFTVAIPLFNKEKFVARAIESVLKQRFRDFELLIIDDGSTDNSAAIAEELILSKEDCAVVRQPNCGAGATRSACLAQAKGQWIAFLDADDAWQLNHLEELTKIALACPEAKMIATHFIEINEGAFVGIDNRIAIPKYENYFFIASDQPGRINSSNVAIHSSVPAISGYFGNARSGQDLEYWARVALDYPVATSSKITSVYYRGNGGNMETLALERVKRNAPIKELRDVSASLKLLADRAVRNRGLFDRADIRCYINSRLDNAMKMQLVAEQFHQLPHLRRLKLRPKPLNSKALDLISYLPPKVLSSGLKSRQLMRRLKRC